MASRRAATCPAETEAPASRGQLSGHLVSLGNGRWAVEAREQRASLAWEGPPCEASEDRGARMMAVTCSPQEPFEQRRETPYQVGRVRQLQSGRLRPEGNQAVLLPRGSPQTRMNRMGPAGCQAPVATVPGGPREMGGG